MSDSQTIEAGVYWISAVALIFRFFLPGLAWVWLFGAFSFSGKSWRRWVVAAWLSMLVSVLFTTLLAIGLGEFGLLRGRIPWWATGCWVGAGLVLGGLKQPTRLGRSLRAGLPGMLVCALVWLAAQCLPQRGEWVVGGWDPGIYINHGVYVATQGTFHPEPAAGYTEISEDELALFTRRDEGYVETFTGVPIDTAHRNHEIYFFRLMPALIAVLVDCGGLRAALRVNFILALPAMLAFFVMCLAFRRALPFALLALCLLITQPVWQYLIHLPTSEMLQLFLLSSAVALIVGSRNPRDTLLAACCFFGAVINRLTFLPMGLLLLGIWSFENLLGAERKNDGHIVIMGSALLTGIGANLLTAQVTIA
ncbi:MAG: hypothetical protein EOM20_19375, partial [Spartobacteria bacterium]|nr:hypothetical protein [Spartobacteria bacterium]